MMNPLAKTKRDPKIAATIILAFFAPERQHIQLSACPCYINYLLLYLGTGEGILSNFTALTSVVVLIRFCGVPGKGAAALSQHSLPPAAPLGSNEP